MKEEYFKPVFLWWNGVKYDFSKEYMVHTSGTIISLYTGKPLKPFLSKGFSYYKVNLYKDKQPLNATVHKIVCSSFPEICGEYFEGAESNHKDENTLNNSAYNLEFVKPIENKRFGTRINRVAAKRKNGKMSKHVLQYDMDGNFMKEWISVREIERELGFLHSNISKCCNGKLQTAYGFIWKYKE